IPGINPGRLHIDSVLADWEVSSRKNTDWEPIEEEFSNIMMMLVPPGCFVIGSNTGDIDELNGKQVCFEKPFWIDKYEVTNEQTGSYGCERTSNSPQEPRNCINWFEAEEYCQGLGGRLPGEAEWEYAAAGPNGLTYPWGNLFAADYAIHRYTTGYGNTGVAPVGTISQGESWTGALDMSGNVWEWTRSIYMDYPYDKDDGREATLEDVADARRVLRGGAYDSSDYDLRTKVRHWFTASSTTEFLGFRCMRDFE
ncbi:MAG: formylglycine-generating enzyme family protein, partial [Aggregatilineales bacterium]